MTTAKAVGQVHCAYCQLPVPGVQSSPTGDSDDSPVYCCYGCRLASEITRGSGEEAAVRWMLVRVGTAIFMTLNLMVFTMALWTPDIYGTGMSDSKMARAYDDLFRHLSLLSAAPVMLLLGPPLARSAWAGLREGRPGSDLLVVVGVWAAFLASMYAVLSGGGPIYFEVACVVLIFVTMGRWLEASGKLHTQQAMDDLARMMPETALVVRASGVESVPVEEVVIGDVLQLRPGDRVACDCVVESGESSADEQVITGESVPVFKCRGDRLFSGSLIVEGTVAARVSAPMSQSTVARLIDHVRQAREIKGKYARMADRVATWLLPAVVIVAAGAGVIHAMHKDLPHGLLVAMSVLLIACPCAVGLATPLAVWSAMGQAAKRGVLFSDGEALERLAEVDTVLFDKTGTLTTGKPRLVQWRWSVGEPSEADVRKLADLAGRSSHPLAKSLKETLEETGPSGTAVTAVIGEHEFDSGKSAGVSSKDRAINRVETRPGRGILGFAGADGESTCVAMLGSPALFGELGVDLAVGLQSTLAKALAGGKSVLVYDERRELVVQAVFAFDEALRPDSREAMEMLKKNSDGLKVEVLTGDHKQAGDRLAAELGVEVQSELLPEQKQAIVRNYQQEGRVVAFVGEGYNDAPALATSDVGIALGAGADLTRDNASVCILGNNMTAVVYVLELSRRTVARIRRNLFWAFFYNIIGIFFAAAGLLSPTMAAAIMFISSIAVVWGSSRSDETGEVTASEKRVESSEVLEIKVINGQA